MVVGLAKCVTQALARALKQGPITWGRKVGMIYDERRMGLWPAGTSSRRIPSIPLG